MTEATESTNTVEPTTYQRWFGRSKLYEVEVVLFGFALVLGNRAIFWNAILASGYNTLIVNTFLTGGGFICLALCMGEMTSALPFSGGIFGFVRAATGPYYGFMVACCEVFLSLTIVIGVTQYATVIPLMTGYIDASFQPKLIGIFFGLNLFINLLGGKPFWIIVNMAGFLIFFLLFTYIFGILLEVNNKSTTDFTTYCKTDKPIEFDGVMLQYPAVLSQFLGLEYIPLLSELTVEPRKTIPRALMICSTTFLVFTIFVSLAACSTAPGQMILQMVPTPLMFGFQKILRVDFNQSVWLHFPALYSSTFTLIFCSGRQLFTIAKSGFLPSFFTHTTPQTGTPFVTLTLVCSVGVGIAMFFNDYPEYSPTLIATIYICSYTILMNAFIAYLFFRKKYSTLLRSFHSPLGRWGAFYGIGWCLFGFISEFHYQNRKPVLNAIYILLMYLGCATLFYWFYLVRNQVFSEEEKKLLFKAYLINANREKRLRMLRNNRVASASTAPKSKALSSASSDSQGKSIGDATVLSNEPKDLNNLHKPAFRDHYLTLRTAEETEMKNSPNLQTKSLSEKIVQFVIEKVNGVSSEELQEYEKLVVITSGGLIEEESKDKELEEQEQEQGDINNDVEQQIPMSE